ncbi:MAG: efflux RND transporter permease subunit [Chlorobi bacterium]|nr:efflux RND transporter permease subunit [Chlorobiota bacterium]
MKKLIRTAVDYPVTLLMIILAILLLGYISFDRLGVDLFPSLESPRLYVTLKTGEKPPEEIEKNFTESIEALAIRQRGATRVSSVTKTGAALITVEYSWDKDMDEAFLDLQKTVTGASQNWDVDELTISQIDPNSEPVMVIAFSNPGVGDMNALRKTAENYIRNELIRLDGIADIKITGAENKEVSIKTDRYLLRAHNLTLDNLKTQIDNFNRTVSGGSIVEFGKKYIIKGVSIFGTLEDFENTILKFERTASLDTVTEAPIYLKDVATVEFINDKPENIVSLNGKRCLGLQIYKETKYNTVKAVEELGKSLTKLRKALPGYNFDVIQNQGKFIRASIDEVEQSALYGIVLAVIVLFVFLRRFGVTAIISAAIPISIVATFNLMYFNHLSLNIMTLGGLALGAGMLVDNAIVVMENIYRNLESGMSLKEAAVTGTAEVGGAITASTITTIVVFLPIVYLHGASGELFKDQAWTVAFSLISSLFVALLFIPMLTIKFLRTGKSKSVPETITFKRYPDFLRKVLQRKWTVIIAALILVLFSVSLLPLIGSEFMPKSEKKTFSIRLTLPEGTELLTTYKTTVALENLMKEKFGKTLEKFFIQAGPSGSENGNESFFEDENSANVKMIFDKNTKLSSAEIESAIANIFSTVPEMEFSFVDYENPLNMMLGTETAPIQVEIKGEDLETLQKLTNEALTKLRETKFLSNLQSSFENGAPEINIQIDRLKCGLYNITPAQISAQIESQLNGDNAGQWDFEGEMNDINLSLPKIELSKLEDLPIRINGSEFQLSELAEITTANAPKEIYRTDQTRVGRITADISSPAPYDRIASEVKDILAGINFPPDYKAAVTGEETKREESMRNLTFALLLSIILVYMALASQFESLIHPFTILLTIPLAGVGALLTFFILGMPLNIMAYIGIIMLVGIAVNDSIILVDAINQLKRKGMELNEAIIAAGGRRIRPIIMTSLTTILALLPLTINFGEGSELRAPMALAVIGGLLSSTLLTLVVIPCVYSVLDQFKDKMNKMFYGGK